jgi:hypothetical protein
MTTPIIRTILVACIVAGVWTPTALAQETGQAMKPITLTELILNDGSKLFGRIELADETKIVFRTLAGAQVTVPLTKIASIKNVAGTIRNREFLPPDPNTTRLFFAPTGRSLRRGQVYLGVYEFVMPFVQVGVTDRFSVGGGTPLLFGIDEWDRPFWVTPKLQVFDRDSTQVAVGVLQAFDSDGDGGGIAYSVVSRGNDVRGFTAGVGLAYGNDGGRAGVLMLGGEARIGRRVKAITENYIWKDGNGIISGGFRFFGDQLSADLALLVPIGADEFFIVPMINFVYVLRP